VVIFVQLFLNCRHYCSWRLLEPWLGESVGGSQISLREKLIGGHAHIAWPRDTCPNTAPVDRWFLAGTKHNLLVHNRLYTFSIQLDVASFAITSQ
jgi:hypothetical protein